MVEVAFESIHMSGPEAAERSQPGIDLLEGFGPQPVETALRVHPRLHETCLAQHAQVLGDRGCGIQAALDLSYRPLCEASRLRIARRFGSAMIANTDSM